MHDVVNFKTKLDVHQTDFALLVRDKFCLMSIIYCFVLFRFPLIFLFCCVFFFTTEVAVSRR